MKPGQPLGKTSLGQDITRLRVMRLSQQQSRFRDVTFNGDLHSYKNAADYTVYGFVPLSAALTSTSWDGDSYSTTAKTLIDLSTVFSAPAGIKAVLFDITIADSGSAGTDCYLILSNNNTPGVGQAADCHVVNDRQHRTQRIITCDSNGDVYYQINASGVNTFDVWLRIRGYWI